MRALASADKALVSAGVMQPISDFKKEEPTDEVSLKVCAGHSLVWCLAADPTGAVRAMGAMDLVIVLDSILCNRP